MEVIHYHIYRGKFTCIFYDNHSFYKTYCDEKESLVVSLVNELNMKKDFIVYKAIINGTKVNYGIFKSKIDIKPISKKITIEELMNDDDHIMIDVIKDKLKPYIRDKKINDIIYGN